MSSSHSSLRRPPRGPSPRAWLPLLAAAACWPGAALAQGGRPPTPVKAARVTRQNLAPSQTFPGTAVGIRRVVVASREEGVIAKRVRGYFSVKVAEGDVLVRLDDSQVRHQGTAAEAEAEAAKARYDEALAGERPETVAEARAELRRTEAAHKEAKQSLERYRDLRERNAATQDQLDQAVRRAEVANQEKSAAWSRLDRLLKGTRQEIVAREESAWKAAEARAELARQRLRDHVVKAPFPGTVNEVFVEVGGWVERGGKVVELIDSQKLDVAVLVPQDRIHRVPLGAPSRCQFPGADGPVPVTGKVAALGPQATMQGRMVPIVVRVDNADGRLRSGMSCTVEVPLGEAESRLVVPKDAVVRSLDGGARVVRVKDGAAEPVPVRLGLESAGMVVVEDGLAEDDLVVTRGNESLQPGQPVQVEQEVLEGELVEADGEATP